MEALTVALRGTGLGAAMASDGATVMIRPVLQHDTTDAKAAVRGQVIDSATGRGLGGVSVVLRGSKLATLTDQEGEFILTGVPLGDQVFEFKYLGYRSASQTINVSAGRSTILKQTLSPSARLLSGVVTTAIGEQRALEVGSTSVSINVDSLQRVAPITSVTDILESRVPGMTVQRTSGTPGDPARIRIRGAGSIYQNSDPIIVVDGIRMYSQQSDERNVNTSGNRTYATPSPLDLIDPNMIEKIEVLRGPSASAMYGSDAGNGVILITTKRGQAGPPLWNAVVTAGTSRLGGQWPTSMYKWITQHTGGAPSLCIGFCGDAVVDSIVEFQALNNPYLTPLGTGSVLGSSVRVSGGNQTIDYAITIPWGRERGILKLPKIEEDRYEKFQLNPVPGWMRRPDLLERRGAQGQMGIQVASQTNIRASSILNQTVQYRTSMSNGQETAIRTLQKKWVDLSQLSETPLLGNPYERVTATVLSLQNTVLINTRPVFWLPLTGRVGTNTIIDNSEMRIAPGLIITGTESGGSLRAASRTSTGVSGDIGSQIPIRGRTTVAVGMNFNRIRTSDQSGGLFDFPEGVTDPSEGEDTNNATFSRRTSDAISMGWWIEPRFGLSSRFFVNPGFRLDNNGLSGKNAKFNGLPRLNFSWLVSDEKFFPWQNSDVVSQLRIRTGFGVSGEQPKQDQLHRLYRSRTINPYGGEEPLYGEMMELSSLGNTRLRPERVEEIEGGIDLDLWNGRVALQWSYWRKRRMDAIVSNQIAASIKGGTSPDLKMNVGDLEDSGTDLILDAQLVEGRNFAFRINMNFDRSQSLVRRLNALGDLSSSSFGNIRYVVGYPSDGIWMRPILGYSDLDGNGWLKGSEITIGAEPVFVGSTMPAYRLGIHPGMNLFGRIAISATFSHVSGQLQTISTLSLPQAGEIDPHTSRVIQGPNGFDRQVAYLVRNGVNGTEIRSDIGFAQKVNMTRWQSASVSVNVSPALLRWIHARSASVSLQGQNLGLWTNYIGVDPNVNSVLGAHGLQDNGQQPEPRVWTLRFSIGN